MENADLIVDLQFGSTGKGLIAGYLALQNQYDIVVNANMPNAGHTFIDYNGNVMVHKVLPNGVVSPKCRYALIGPGSVFSLKQLLSEIAHLDTIGYDHFDVVIHHRAVVLQSEHWESEQKFLKIGSTAQGSAAAMIHKINRDPEDNPTAGSVFGYDNKLSRIHIVGNDNYDDLIRGAKQILLEGAQGFSLGINERFYPYSTSRDCTPARFLSDMGIPLPYLRKVIGTARTYPIRVGSPASGFSGKAYHDQEELAWKDIGIEPERTTVTQRIRRVFTFSEAQIRDAMWTMAPDEVFLNFCNYVTDFDEAKRIHAAFNGKIRYYGYGPGVGDIVDSQAMKYENYEWRV